MAHGVIVRLRTALERAGKLATMLAATSREAFMNDRLVQAAIQQQLRLVAVSLAGALKRDPRLLTALPQAAAIVEMGETILHEYDHLDLAAIWELATNDIPETAGVLELLVETYVEDPAPPARADLLIPLIAEQRERIAALCRENGIQRLAVFGSAVNGTFNPETSDIDVVAEFDDSQGDALRLGRFAFDLEALLGRPVDVVTLHERSKPRFREEVERTAVAIYDSGAIVTVD
jgi:hypothetical protein